MEKALLLIVNIIIIIIIFIYVASIVFDFIIAPIFAIITAAILFPILNSFLRVLLLILVPLAGIGSIFTPLFLAYDNKNYELFSLIGILGWSLLLILSLVVLNKIEKEKKFLFMFLIVFAVISNILLFADKKIKLKESIEEVKTAIKEKEGLLLCTSNSHRYVFLFPVNKSKLEFISPYKVNVFWKSKFYSFPVSSCSYITNIDKEGKIKEAYCGEFHLFNIEKIKVKTKNTVPILSKIFLKKEWISNTYLWNEKYGLAFKLSKCKITKILK